MKKGLIYLSLLAMVFGFMAFQCSSAELTGAKLYINQKQYDKAKESLLKEVQKNPASDEGWYLLGYLYGEEGEMEKMLESFDKSVAASQKFVPQINESKKYYWATNFNKGVSLFNNATKASSADSSKIFYDKAIKSFQNAILMEPDSIASYSNLIYAYINTNQIAEAVPVLEKANKLAKDPETFSMLGQIHNEEGNKLMDQYRTSKNAADSVKAMEKFNEAIKVLESGRKLFPENGDILLRLSNAYIGANKLDVAMTAFRAGIEKDPTNKYYHYNYGVLLLNSKDFSGAEKEFMEAVKLDAEYSNAIYNLAVTYVRWGTEIREEMEAKGEVSDSFKEKFNLAIPHLEKYLEINPREPQIWELLGKVYANLGMQEKSIEAFNKADQYR